jgi:hypothetical protein
MNAFGRPPRRTVLLLDAAVVAWLAVWLVAGVLVAREVEELNELTETMEVAAGAIEETGDVLRTVGNVPFIGGQVTELAERIQRTGARTRQSAAESRDTVSSLSRLLGVSVAAMPILLLLLLYLPLRLLWRREAESIRRALRRDPSDAVLDEFLARRAVLSLPYARLRRLTENPWRDLEDGRHAALADAELARLGIRRPPQRR